MGNSVQRGATVSNLAGVDLAPAQGVKQEAAVQSVVLPKVASVAADTAHKLEQGSSGTGGINWMEPPQTSGPVSEQQAAAAAEHLLFNGATSLAAALGVKEPVPPGAGTPQQPQSPFHNALGVSVEALAMYGMLLYIKQVSTNAKLDFKAAQGDGAAQATQFKQKEDAWLKERKEQYEAAHPSRIGEILKDVLSAVSALADVGEGVVELIAFDPQGFASITAGLAQGVAAVLQVTAQAEQGHNPGEAAKLNRIANDITYAAVGLAVVGGCVGQLFTSGGAAPIAAEVVSFASKIAGKVTTAASAVTDGTTAIILGHETKAAGQADVAQRNADFELQFIQFIQNMALKNMQSDTDNQSKARQHIANINSSCMNSMQAAARAI